MPAPLVVVRHEAIGTLVGCQQECSELCSDLLTVDKSRRYNAEAMARNKQDLLQGTLDLLILQTLALEPMHGWGISQRIQQISRDVLQVNQGSLYPALHRLEQQGWIDAEWDASENNRQAKYYRLTRNGRKQLVTERENWERMADAVTRILRTQE
jgi:PadR family transcriptional regulator PadR